MFEGINRQRLEGLSPVAQETVTEIEQLHRGISRSYLAFIAEIGVGACEAGWFYLPTPIEEFAGHQSFKIYQSSAYRSFFARLFPAKTPAGAVVVADTGASWKYCFSRKRGEAVYTWDMADGSFDPTHRHFEDFVRKLSE